MRTRRALFLMEAEGVGHPDAGLSVVAGQGGHLLDLPFQVGDRLLAFLDFGSKGHGGIRCQATGRDSFWLRWVRLGGS
jgi:hypothetical protein